MCTYTNGHTQALTLSHTHLRTQCRLKGTKDFALLQLFIVIHSVFGLFFSCFHEALPLYCPSITQIHTLTHVTYTHTFKRHALHTQKQCFVSVSFLSMHTHVCVCVCVCVFVCVFELLKSVTTGLTPPMSWHGTWREWQRAFVTATIRERGAAVW